MAHRVTSGVIGTDRKGASVFNRREIVPFMADVKQFSLFVQALLHMMTTVDSNSNLSFFQIAGIHGAPYIPYDGAGVQHVEPTPEFLGYCSHGSVLFPTWHRPYMALIEQELQRVALDIAQRYTNFKPDWVDAAIQLRFPYWDWSSTARPPRELYTQPQLTVALPPLGNSGAIDNPFLLYRFQQKPADFPNPFVMPAWNSVTHRWGKANTSTGVVEDVIMRPHRDEPSVRCAPGRCGRCGLPGLEAGE